MEGKNLQSKGDNKYKKKSKEIVIKNLKILKGEELELIEGCIRIREGIIKEIKPHIDRGKDVVIYDGSGYLALPCFVNAHTHVGDSIAKDIGIGLNLKDLVHPIYGLKRKMLQEAKDESLINSMKSSLEDMLRQGFFCFCDFREGAVKGVKLLKEALKEVKIQAIILGRAEYYFDEKELLEDRELPNKVVRELSDVLEVSDGLGLSGANEYSNRALIKIGELVRERGKLLAIHAAESKDTKFFSYSKTFMSEVERIMRFLKPNFLIHLTQADEKDLDLIWKGKAGVVVCPRANAELSVGFPPISKMLKKGLLVAIGSDNFMLNSPEPFKEMDYLIKVSSIMEEKPYPLKPRDVLKMITVNGAKLLKLDKAGPIDVNFHSNMILIDLKDKNLEGSKDIIASVVRRGRVDNIKAIMVNGEWVYGRI
ncbi:MAG: amidohydrolase family protein [Nitrososphaerales archaeon]